jgi:hypothetical protein
MDWLATEYLNEFDDGFNVRMTQDIVEMANTHEIRFEKFLGSAFCVPELGRVNLIIIICAPSLVSSGGRGLDTANSRKNG